MMVDHNNPLIRLYFFWGGGKRGIGGNVGPLDFVGNKTSDIIFKSLR